MTPLLAAVLFAGGTRRVKPEYCNRAIVSFPLDPFFYDTLGVTAGITFFALTDSTFMTYEKDTLGVETSVTMFALIESVIPTVSIDLLSANYSVTSFTISDVVKVADNLATPDKLGVVYGIGGGQFTLTDSVKVTQSQPEVLNVTYGITQFELGAP